MTSVSELGDRHLRAASGLEDAREATAVAVCIVVSDEWGSSIAGQLLVSCLVNLLCRQVGVISRIELKAKPTPLLIGLPLGPTSAPFPDCLEGLARWAVGDSVAVSARPEGERCDHAILVGDAKCIQQSTHSLSVIGDGWCSWVGEPDNAPRGIKPQSKNSLGPFLGAALAAGEVFKRSRGVVRDRYLTSDGFSLWSGEVASEWSALTQGPELPGRILPPVHVVGAGAVGNAFAYIVAYADFSDAYLVVMDDDRYDGTNLNRCLAAGIQDVGHPKVEAIARLLRGTGASCFPYPRTIKEYIADPRRDLRVDAAQQANDLEFGIVLSCVDKGTSRQDVQGLRPHLLLGASTLDLRARSNIYGLWDGCACLGCFNAKERDGEKLRALEHHVRELHEPERRGYFLKHGLDAEAIEQHLADPKCGSIGEAALREFSTQPPQEFSVGFVSLGAGLLLASALFRHEIFNVDARGDMTNLNFLNGGFMDSGLGADPSCEMKCTGSLASRNR